MGFNNSNMKFDIILPTYNGERYINESIESVLKQTYTNWHLFIVDDASMDSTPNILEQFQQNYPNKISVIFLQDNRRTTGARMEAIKNAKGDILAFIDQDDLWHKNKLELQHLEFQKGFDVVHTGFEFINEKGGIILSQKSDQENFKRKQIFKESTSSSSIKKHLCLNNYIQFTSSAITRKAFEEVGGFDTSLFGGEDWEFWLRVVMNDKKIKYIDKKLTYKRVHRYNTSNVYRAERHKGLLKAYAKIEKLYPELRKCLKLRRYYTYRKSIVSLIQAKKFKEVKLFYRKKINRGNSNISFFRKQILFLFAYSGYLGYFARKAKNIMRKIFKDVT